jgi:protein tyrosine phosphatase
MRTSSLDSSLLKIFLFSVALGFCTLSQAEPKTKSKPINPQAVSLLAALPSSYREAKFQEVEQAFEQRWNLFIKGKQFKKYTPNRSAAEIAEEFQHLATLRLQTCFVDPKASHLISKSEYMIAQDLLEKGFFRSPHTIAFQYNRTDPSYNSSIIVVNGFRFLALEGPKPELVKNFFTVLQNHQVTQLVRLTAATEKGKTKSYPYWIGKTKTDPKTAEMFLQIPQVKNKIPYDIQYYAIDTWYDQQGISPKILLNLILKVRKSYNPTTGLLATHCAGGIGRTGTFLAGFILLNEIDKQIAKGITPANVDISIEKTVFQLSLQRTFMVTKSTQYQTLYRLVDLYLKSQNNIIQSLNETAAPVLNVNPTQ